jgi:hypothetical protein
MDSIVREMVRRRAQDRREYCRLPQSAVDATFHVDHVVARQHTDQPDDDPDGLALACDRCNFHKGTNLSNIDPVTQQTVPLLDPRKDTWEDHLAMEEARIVGLTPKGRATARLLRMNARNRVELREWLIQDGRW